MPPQRGSQTSARNPRPSARVDVLARASSRGARPASWRRPLVVRETGKTWREADVDLCEAVHFCDYYAAGAERLAAGRRGTCRARRRLSYDGAASPW